MNKFYVFCGGFCALIGVIAIGFAIASKSIVLSAARIVIKGLVSPQSLKDATAKFQQCSAYKEEFAYPFTKSNRKWKADDFEEKCQSRAKSHYYLYHLKNKQGVMNGSEVPILERRGPWVFKTEFRDYTLEEAFDGKALSQTSRSWAMIDEVETASLCPKCATDKLCASWDYSGASTEKWPASCKTGTRAGDADYNAITHPNPGYIGLLNLLELIDGADEKFVVYLFGSQAMVQVFGPQSKAVQYLKGFPQGQDQPGKQFSGNCSAASFSLSTISTFQNGGMVYPIELDCFLRRADSDIGSATLIPRKLTTSALNGWGTAKRNRILWFMNGANMTTGLSPTQTAPLYSNLPMGWAGLRWAALSSAYKGLSQVYGYVRGSGSSWTSTATAIGKGPYTYDQVCGSALTMALAQVKDSEAKDAFDPLLGRHMTCIELETLVSYTYYIAEKYAVENKIWNPTCDAARLTQNTECMDECKAYKGCEETPAARGLKIGWLNCSQKCSNFKPCYFNKLGWAQYNYPSSLENPVADHAPGRKGGLFITLEAQSIFRGYTDSIRVLLEDVLGIDSGASSRSSGIVNQANTPYQAKDVYHDEACWENSAFVESLLEEGPQVVGGPTKTCNAPDDAQRENNYKASTQSQGDKHLKPCHYKAKSYYSSKYSLPKAGDKLLQVASVGGKGKVKGLKNRDNPFGQYMMSSVDTWGEEVQVEGYTSNVLPALMAKGNEKEEKIYFELQNGAVSESEAEMTMKEANEANSNIFPETYKIWTSPLQRPTMFEYKNMISVNGEKYGVKGRRFSPRWFTRFTKNTTSSDAIGGARLNPKCLVNLKKRDQVDLYVGNKDFHGCKADADQKFSEFSENVTNKILYRAQIVNSDGTPIKSTDGDALSLDIEPVTGIAIGGNIASGVYLKVGGNSPVYGPNVKQSIIPYFSVTSTQKATGEEIDLLYTSINAIAGMLDLLQAILYSVGGVFCFVGMYLVIYGLKGAQKSGKSRARGSVTKNKNAEVVELGHVSTIVSVPATSTINPPDSTFSSQTATVNPLQTQDPNALATFSAKAEVPRTNLQGSARNGTQQVLL